MKNSQLEKELEKESTGQGETQEPVWSKRPKESVKRSRLTVSNVTKFKGKR